MTAHVPSRCQETLSAMEPCANSNINRARRLEHLAVAVQSGRVGYHSLPTDLETLAVPPDIAQRLQFLHACRGSNPQSFVAQHLPSQKAWYQDYYLRRFVLVSPFLIASICAVWVLGGCQRQLLQPSLQRLSGSLGLAEAISDFDPLGACGTVENHTDYGVRDMFTLPNVEMEVCCVTCRDDPLCQGWTWVRMLSGLDVENMCHLKGQGQLLDHIESNMSISGRPFRPELSDSRPDSLLCFTLILPYGHELELLRWQHKQNTSIFSCEEWQVYSNESTALAPGINTSQVYGTDLQCKQPLNHTDSPYHCLNAQIFMEVWKKVIAQGRFVFHSWTVKVDADAVFLPTRLQLVLRHIKEPSRGLFLTSCESGLHGAIEVLSRRAVQAYSIGWVRCVEGNESINQIVREDNFMEQCLSGVLKVYHRHMSNLLSERSCAARGEDDVIWFGLVCLGLPWLGLV